MSKIRTQPSVAATRMESGILRGGLQALALAALLCGALPGSAPAQTTEPPPAQGNAGAPARAPDAAPNVSVPGFWDPKRRLDRPEILSSTVIRFLTEGDYPPFNYAGADGNPAGFNVDLARMLCEELRVGCTVQIRRFDTLIDSLSDGRGDAIIASLAVSTDMRRRVDLTDPYYRSPARFVARKDTALPEMIPELLGGKRIAVVAGSAHEAYLKMLFAGVDLRSFPNIDAARQALRNGDVELLFGDGIQSAFWLNGSDSAGCCAFRGGPFTESRYFGEGVGIAVRRGNDTLRNALDWALFRVWEKGRFADLWLRYFPINPF